jgi:hypothetical protein
MQISTEIVLQLIISYKMYSKNNKNKITWSTWVKTNNSDDKVSAYTSWYNIIANADNRNVLPTEQTSVYLGTYRYPPRYKNQTNDNTY